MFAQSNQTFITLHSIPSWVRTVRDPAACQLQTYPPYLTQQAPSSLRLGKTKCPITHDYIWAFCDKSDTGKTGGRSVGQRERASQGDLICSDSKMADRGLAFTRFCFVFNFKCIKNHQENWFNPETKGCFYSGYLMLSCHIPLLLLNFSLWSWKVSTHSLSPRHSLAFSSALIDHSKTRSQRSRPKRTCLTFQPAFS